MRLPTMMRADETGDTGVDVHDGAASEVDGAPQEHLTGVCHDGVKRFLCPLLGVAIGRRSKCLGSGVDRVWAGPVPDHVCDREVDQRDPQRDEQRKSRELHAFSECTDDQRRRDGGERHLERDVDELRDVRADREGRSLRVGRYAREKHLRKTADIRRSAGEREAVAVDHPDQRDDADAVENLRQHREEVLRANQAAVKQCEAGDRHQQHEDGGNEHPRVVALVHRRLRGRSRCLRQRRIGDQ